MEVRVTRKEIIQTYELLELLKRWETLQSITEQYSRGTVTLTIDGSRGREIITTHVENCYNDGNTLNSEIATIVGSAVDGAIVKVCDLIKSKLPLPVKD